MKPFYCFIFLITMALVTSILPYPVLSNYTNITENNATQINDFYESELIQKFNQSPQLVQLNFDEVSPLLDGEFEVFDMQSGLSFFAIRTGGKNHADVEPLSIEDVKILNEICEEKPNQTRRPALVKLSENAYIPASFCAYPHGYCVHNKILNGHICLHFKNSLTDSTEKEDSQHQKCVSYATKNGQNFIDSLDL